MGTDELEQLLEGAEETDVLEFKDAMDWDHKTLVKDILAMANVRDGGRIVFGIEDQTYERHGLSEAQVATFEQEAMRDKVSRYADPKVTFRVHKPLDRDGRRYVVIDVTPFDLEPVICRKTGEEVKEGVIYFRSQVKRPASAAVSNSADMRQILLRAASLMHQNIEDHGYRLPNVANDQLDQELGGL